MDHIEQTGLLFFDIFTSNLAFMWRSQVFLDIAMEFEHNKIHFFLIAVLASFLGIMCNYFLGIMTLSIQKYIPQNKESEPLIIGINRLFKKFYLPMLIVVALPIIGKFIAVLAGVAKFNQKKFILTSFISLVFFWTYKIFIM